MSDHIVLTLPLPPSKNRLHSNARRYARDGQGNLRAYTGRVNTPEYDAFRREVWALVRQQTTPEQRDFAGNLEMFVLVTWPELERTRDLVNIADGLSDALKDALDYDDSHFRPWHLADDRSGAPVGCRVLILPAAAAEVGAAS